MSADASADLSADSCVNIFASQQAVVTFLLSFNKEIAQL